MIPPLSPELEQRIEEEANEAALVIAWSSEELEKGNIYIPPKINPTAKEFFKKGAIPYAELWQEAQQRAERYEKALFEIQFKATSAIFPHLPVETLGAQMCIEIEKVATEALTPKTGADERGL